MRKMVLIATAMVALSAAAHAGGSRSLSLSPGDSGALTAPRAADAPRSAETMAPVAAPVIAAPATQTVSAVPIAPAPVAPVAAPARVTPVTTAAVAPTARQSDDLRLQQDARPSRRQRAARTSRSSGKRWTKSRIISELHRHGIYQ